MALHGAENNNFLVHLFNEALDSASSWYYASTEVRSKSIELSGSIWVVVKCS